MFTKNNFIRMNTKFQLIFLTKYYNKRQNFGASSKSAFHLL